MARMKTLLDNHRPTRLIPTPGLLKVSGSRHAWFTSNVLVLDDPALEDAIGADTLSSLEPGTYVELIVTGDAIAPGEKGYMHAACRLYDLLDLRPERLERYVKAKAVMGLKSIGGISRMTQSMNGARCHINAQGLDLRLFESDNGAIYLPADEAQHVGATEVMFQRREMPAVMFEHSSLKALLMPYGHTSIFER